MFTATGLVKCRFVGLLRLWFPISVHTCTKKYRTVYILYTMITWTSITKLRKFKFVSDSCNYVLENLIVLGLWKNSLRFMEPESFLPCSQGPPPIRIPSKISTVHVLRTDLFKMRLSKRWVRDLLEQYATSKLEDQLLSVSTTVNSVYSLLPIIHGGRPGHP